MLLYPYLKGADALGLRRVRARHLRASEGGAERESCDGRAVRRVAQRVWRQAQRAQLTLRKLSQSSTWESRGVWGTGIGGVRDTFRNRDTFRSRAGSLTRVFDLCT